MQVSTLNCSSAWGRNPLTGLTDCLPETDERCGLDHGVTRAVGAMAEIDDGRARSYCEGGWQSVIKKCRSTKLTGIRTIDTSTISSSGTKMSSTDPYYGQNQ